MDHHKKKNNPILSPFSQIYCSKKAIKILLTLSLFCVLFSYSSLFSSLFSTFSMKLFGYYYSTDRNYIFLLCNGILILIFKNSGLLANAPSGTDHFRDNYAKKIVQSHQSTGFREYNVKKNAQSNQYESVSDVSSQTNAEEIRKAVVEVDKVERAIISFTDEVGENVTLIAHNEEKEKEIVELLNFVEEEEEEELVNMEEEEEEEGIELLSREELNKKCEEFIRKMKDGIKFEALYLAKNKIKFEAQHQLITV